MAKRKIERIKQTCMDFANPSEEDKARLEKDIARYFDSCDRENSEKMTKPYTLSGLLYYIRISKENFTELISGSGAVLAERALLKIESFLEENALNGNLPSNAAMNSLKINFGYGEKEQEKPSGISVTLDTEAQKLGE